jgi:hypothetical protein
VQHEARSACRARLCAQEAFDDGQPVVLALKKRLPSSFACASSNSARFAPMKTEVTIAMRMERNVTPKMITTLPRTRPQAVCGTTSP